MSKTKHWIVCAAMLTLCAGSARADRYELGFASGARWMRSGSVDTLTADDSHPVVGLSGAVRLDGVRPFGFDLYVDAGYDREQLAGTTYNRIDTELSMHSFRAGARVERPLRPWLAAFGRATVGYTTGLLSLDDQLSAAARPTRDRAHAVTSSIGGGLSLAVIRTSRVRLSLRAELDYTVVSPLHFEASPQEADDGTLTIPVLSASLGDVDVSGVGMRVGLVGRF